LYRYVGAPYVERMFTEFNLPAFVPVDSQMAPDPEFPTVVYPNPEEGRSTWAESFAAATAAGWGAVQVQSSLLQFTHSFKAPGFNPCA
jgi:phosphomannomutase